MDDDDELEDGQADKDSLFSQVMRTHRTHLPRPTARGALCALLPSCSQPAVCRIMVCGHPTRTGAMFLT